jgi:hypothetical protein
VNIRILRDLFIWFLETDAATIDAFVPAAIGTLKRSVIMTKKAARKAAARKKNAKKVAAKPSVKKAATRPSRKKLQLAPLKKLQDVDSIDAALAKM